MFDNAIRRSSVLRFSTRWPYLDFYSFCEFHHCLRIEVSCIVSIYLDSNLFVVLS